MLAKLQALTLSWFLYVSSAKNISSLEVANEPVHESPEILAEPEVFDRFGPQSCVMLSSTTHRTCMISTRCADLDLDDVDFRFVCFNPGTTVPHALHSFGRGGFGGEEDFDTGVVCDKCTSVASAMQQGGPLVRSALRTLPQDFIVDAASSAGAVDSVEHSLPTVGSQTVVSSSDTIHSVPSVETVHTVGPAVHTVGPAEVSVEDPAREPESVTHLVPVAHDVATVPQPVTIVRQPAPVQVVHAQPQPVQVVHAAEPVIRAVPVVHPVAQPVTIPVRATIHSPMSLPVDVQHDARHAPPIIEGLSPRIRVEPEPQVRTVHAVHAAPAVHTVSTASPAQAAYFGPSSCIVTFRSPTGSCIIQTRCEEGSLASFNVGVTCLDRGGGYTRYLFGKDSFHNEETFDTRIQCEQCLGVEDQAQKHGTYPPNMAENMNALKKEVQMLHEEVKGLLEAQPGGAPCDMDAPLVDEPAPIHPPEPAEVHTPEPAHHAPQPAHHAPQPAHHAPQPAHHAPQAAPHAHEPAQVLPHAPKPVDEFEEERRPTPAPEPVAEEAPAVQAPEPEAPAEEPPPAINTAPSIAPAQGGPAPTATQESQPTQTTNGGTTTHTTHTIVTHHGPQGGASSPNGGSSQSSTSNSFGTNGFGGNGNGGNFGGSNGVNGFGGFGNGGNFGGSNGFGGFGNGGNFGGSNGFGGFGNGGNGNGDNTGGHDEDEQEDAQALAPAPALAAAPSASLTRPTLPPPQIIPTAPKESLVAAPRGHGNELGAALASAARLTDKPRSSDEVLLDGSDGDEDFASKVFSGASDEHEVASNVERRAPPADHGHDAHHTVRKLKDLLLHASR